MNAQCNLKLRWVVSLVLVVFLTATTPLSAGLVGYWAMDEASWNGTTGEVLDSSGKDHHGKAAYDATTTLDAERGTVGVFDGSRDNVTVPAHLDFDLGLNATISLWTKFASLPTSTHQIIGGSYYPNNFLLNQYGASIDGDNLLVYWRSDGNKAATIGTLALDTWQHLAVTNDDGWLTIYIDGTEMASGAQGTNSYIRDAIGIGGRPSGSWTIDGRIDDVAIWTNALEPELIAGLAAGASPLSIPEPSTFVLAAFGLFGLGIAARRKRRR